jgi:hypothetical protein
MSPAQVGLDEILRGTMKIFLLDSEFIFSFYVAKESGPGGVGWKT